MIKHYHKQFTKNEETFQMDNNLTVTKFSWRKAAERVSEIAGKPYSAQYIREVATGYRTNQKLFTAAQTALIFQYLGEP